MFFNRSRRVNLVLLFRSCLETPFVWKTMYILNSQDVAGSWLSLHLEHRLEKAQKHWGHKVLKDFLRCSMCGVCKGMFVYLCDIPLDLGWLVCLWGSRAIHKIFKPIHQISRVIQKIPRIFVKVSRVIYKIYKVIYMFFRVIS